MLALSLFSEVNPMPYISKEQLAAAREMDLLTYLQRHDPNELVHFSGRTYTTRTHDSLKISNGKWCWWSRGIGGSTALDYLIEVRGYSLPEAVAAIVGTETTTSSRDGPNACVPRESRAPPPFQLPPRHADNRRVFSYLKSRGIAPEIINHCIKHGQLYEDAKHHNCVFVGFEGEQPRYGALRGTLSQSTFVGDVPGSDKRFCFAVPRQADDHDALCVFECAIDALSYLTLMKLRGQDWRRANCLSLAGVYQPGKAGQMKLPLALGQYLKDNPGIRKVILCLDNDEVGRAAAQAIRTRLDAYTVIDNPPRRAKDYNELLQLRLGIAGKVKTRGDEAR